MDDETVDPFGRDDDLMVEAEENGMATATISVSHQTLPNARL
jgi:hypothetical protein